MIDEVNAAARLIAAYLTTANTTRTGVTSAGETCTAEQTTKPPTAVFACSSSTTSLASSSPHDDVINSVTSSLHNTTDDDEEKESSSSSDKQDIECQSSAACASLSHKSGTGIESAEGATCGVDPNNTSEEGEKCKQSVGADSVSGGVSLIDSISAALQAKFHGHWYPSVPSKGSGYRCLKFGAQYLDGAIVSACESCGIDRAEIITSIPNDLILWIDPGEVSYRIGDSVPLTTVFSKQQQGDSMLGRNNPSMGDDSTNRKISMEMSGGTGDDKLSCSPLAGTVGSLPFLGANGGLVGPIYSHLDASDMNNNNICQLPPHAFQAASTAFNPANCSSASPSSVAMAAALCNFNLNKMMMTSAKMQQQLHHSPSAPLNGNMHPNSPHSGLAINGSPFKPAKNPGVPFTGPANPGIINGVMHPGIVPPPHPSADVSSPSPPVNGTAFALGDDGAPHLPVGASSALVYGGVHGRPTTLPGVVSKSPLQNHNSGQLSHSGPAYSQIAAPGRTHNAQRNLPGPQWAKRGGGSRFGTGAGGNIPHCHSFTSLNPEAAIFSPTDSPEQQLGAPMSTNTFSSQMTNSVPQPIPGAVNGHSPSSVVGAASFLDDSRLPPSASGFMSPNMSLNGAPALVFNGNSTIGGGSNRIGGNGKNNHHQQQTPMTSSVCATLNSLVSPSQQFHCGATAAAINQLEFHQQAFRGGSPVDYAFYNNSSRSSSASMLKNNNAVSSLGSNNSSQTQNSNQTQQQQQQMSSASSVSGGSPAVVVTTNGGGSSPSASVIGSPSGSSPGVATGAQTPSPKSSNITSNANGAVTPSASASVTTAAAANNSTMASNNAGSGNIAGNAGSGGSTGSNQQFMTADAFAATKFGSTKLKSRKSNINLSQMSPTQFEAYMRHKTSTMHSRPPHTNYTDAYPPSAPSHYGGAGANASGAFSFSNANGATSNGSSAAPCYFGPMRAGSSGSSTSTPSPCGSFPGFPSPSMVMDPVGLAPRGATGGSVGGLRGAPTHPSAHHNFEQAMHEFCEDPFFQPTGPFQLPVNANNPSQQIGANGNGNYLHMDPSSSVSLANMTSSGAALGPIGVNTRGVSRGDMGPWGMSSGPSSSRLPNGNMMTSRYEQHQQPFAGQFPGVIGSCASNCEVGSKSGVAPGMNSKKNSNVEIFNSIAVSSSAPPTGSSAPTTATITNNFSNNLISATNNDNIGGHIAQHSKVTAGGFMNPFPPNITQSSRVGAN